MIYPDHGRPYRRPGQRRLLIAALGFLFAAGGAIPGFAGDQEHRPELNRIGHIIVIFLENHSFDQLYGMFPGADGVTNASFAAIQVSADGRQFSTLPAVMNSYAAWASGIPPNLLGVDTRFPPGVTQRAVPGRSFRRPRRADRRSGTPVLSRASANRRRQDGSVRGVFRRRCTADGLL
jgi:phospholipase C